MNSLERVEAISNLLKEAISLFNEWTNSEIYEIDELFTSDSKPSYLLSTTEDVFYELQQAISNDEINLNN